MQKEAEGLFWTEDIKAEDKLWADGYLCACMNACVCALWVCILSCLTFLGAHLGLCIGLILVFCKGIGVLQEQANSLCNGE